MSEHVLRGVRVQLTTTMDMVLRTALCEIMKILENALHDHKMEVAQKGEEIAQLKTKLQTAEIKLKDIEYGKSKGAKAKQPSKKPEVRDEKSFSPPEIEFEVPDDWCAPLGYETVTKQPNMVTRQPDMVTKQPNMVTRQPNMVTKQPNMVTKQPNMVTKQPNMVTKQPNMVTKQMNMCPSVKLRKLSIPLWQVPIKKEMLNCSINLQKSKGIRRSTRTCVLNAEPKPAVKQRQFHLKNDMKILLHNIKQEGCDINIRYLRKRNGGENTLTNTPLKDASKQQKKLKAKHGPTPTELQNAEKSGNKKFSCIFCNKLFDTRSGRNIHARFHRTCKGCKKVLKDVYTLRCHIKSCEKFKNRMAKEAMKPPKIYADKKCITEPFKLRVKEESVELSVSSETFTRKYTTSDKRRTNSIETNGELGWMRPLEYTEDNCEAQ